MSINLIFRLIWAAIFAVVAVIFTELLPPIEGTNPLVLRVLVTLLSAGVGFLIFPDIARRITNLTINTFNLIVNRVASETLSQLMRLPRHTQPSIMNPTPQVGGISLQRPLILDTSAIIDGRILDIAKTGFVNGLVLIPSFVLIELQQVADSSDSLKRQRGRRGFEIVDDLKKVHGLKIEIWDKDVVSKSVDERLLRLAKSLNGKIITTDFNLNKLAVAHGVLVLNVNDLANAVKTVSIPGEKLELKVVHVGKDPKQGVGYLPDGTMIVVENGADLIGQNVKLEVTRVIQGSAGRMIFGKKP